MLNIQNTPVSMSSKKQIVLKPASLDKSQPMTQLLGQFKIIKEITKGVQSMKHFVFPSLLQKEAIPVLKKQPNVIIRYCSMSGIKLTLGVPLINNQVRQAIKVQSESPESSKAIFSMIICHSFTRCADMSDFLNELVSFCPEMIDIVNLDSGDLEENLKTIQQEINSSSSDYKHKNKVLICTPGIALKLQKINLFDHKCHAVVLDKIDVLIALESASELDQLASSKNFRPQQVVFTTNVFDESSQGEEDQLQFKELKQSFMGKNKAIVIKMDLSAANEGDQSRFETIKHLYAYTQTQVDKYLLLFCLSKLSIATGKTVIFANDVTQAYRIKFFFARFHFKCFVLSPDMPKNQLQSIVHFFHIGQFDLLVLVHEGYPNKLPEIKDVNTVVNFDVPSAYTTYKNNAHLVDSESGCALTFVQPEEADQLNAISGIESKMIKNYAQMDMMQCLPILWYEVKKVKSRVENVLAALSSKTVMREKNIEFKKQLVSNKSLKGYFKNNPKEKEILQNEIQRGAKLTSKILFKGLNFLPSYCIPSEIMATSEEQMQACTIGTETILLVTKYFGARQQQMSLDQIFVEADNNCQLVQNLVGFPAAVARYHEEQEESSTKYAHEDPTITSVQALEPTSGRKLWKLRHNKPLKKRLRADKTGYKGS